MTTNVPPPEFTTTGLKLPPETDIVDGLWADFQNAFEGRLNPSPATPQGQLVSALAAVVGASNDLFLHYVNQIDPAFADGRMQDAIGRIYYLERIGSLPTSVVCTLTGAPGTVVPQGSLAQAVDGTIYQSVAAATIPTGGSVSATFSALDTGPIGCPAGSLTTIYRVIPGWDSITNPADGVLGRAEETRAEFEERRAASVAAGAGGILGSIRGAVLAVPGVIDAYVTENPTAGAVTIGGVSIAARTLYVAAYGGTDADVAQAIWSKKPPGCGYTGTTTVTITDSSSGYSPPYPSYTVNFERPVALPIYFAVSLANGPAVPSDAIVQVKAALAAAFAGEDGGQRARIGSTVYALRFVSAIEALGSWARVIVLTIGISASPTGSSVTADINEMPTLDQAHIAVSLV